MRRQSSYQVPRSGPETVLPGRVAISRVETDDRAVLIDRKPDGSELEIGPIATTRGARWTRSETLLGVGLVALIMGGAVLNGIAQATKPKPTAEPPVACVPVGDSSHPAMTKLRRTDDPTKEYAGRTGRSMAEDVSSPDDWQLPREQDGLAIGRGTPIEAVSGTGCVVGWSVWIVPTRDVLVAAADSMLKLGSGQLTSTLTEPVALPGPPEDGDWTMRVATAYRTKNGKSIWGVKFFRVVVGGAPYVAPITPTPRPTPEPTLAIAPAVPCAAPDPNRGPPVVNLVVGAQRAPGAMGQFSWFGSETPPGEVTVELSATMPFEGDVEFQIEGDICATRWSISSMPWSYIHDQSRGNTFAESAFASQGDWASFLTNRQDNPIISLQNRIPATPVGIGQVLVRALLNFEGGNTLQAYWLVNIDLVDLPSMRVFGPDGSAVTPVIGCGVGYWDNNGNGYQEDCGNGEWPVLEDGPILTVHEGDILTLESPAWDLQYWGVNWVEQSSVEDGGDVNYLGNIGGQDVRSPNVVRWLAPSAGEYSLRFDLNHQEGDRNFQLPLHIRLNVLP